MTEGTPNKKDTKAKGCAKIGCGVIGAIVIVLLIVGIIMSIIEEDDPEDQKKKAYEARMDSINAKQRSVKDGWITYDEDGNEIKIKPTYKKPAQESSYIIKEFKLTPEEIKMPTIKKALSVYDHARKVWKQTYQKSDDISRDGAYPHECRYLTALYKAQDGSNNLRVKEGLLIKVIEKSRRERGDDAGADEIRDELGSAKDAQGRSKTLSDICDRLIRSKCQYNCKPIPKKKKTKKDYCLCSLVSYNRASPQHAWVRDDSRGVRIGEKNYEKCGYEKYYPNPFNDNYVNVLECSQRVEELYGYSYGDLYGKNE